jgi:hypothetical protein
MQRSSLLPPATGLPDPKSAGHIPGVEQHSRWFDLWLSLGAGILTVALFYSLAGPLRERNRPEDPPK